MLVDRTHHYFRNYRSFIAVAFVFVILVVAAVVSSVILTTRARFLFLIDDAISNWPLITLLYAVAHPATQPSLQCSVP